MVTTIRHEKQSRCRFCKHEKSKKIINLLCCWGMQKRLKYSTSSLFLSFSALCPGRWLVSFPSLSESMDAWMLHSRWKSSLFRLSSVVRWWTLWRPTQLHVALSCTTSLIRSLRSWRTTSTSAAVKPEPASLFCSPSRPAAFLPPTWLLGSATKQEAFGRVFPTDCYFSSRVKDSNLPLKRQTCVSQIFSHDTNSYTLEGTCRTSELFLDVCTVTGTYSKPWWQSLHTEPPLFCKGTSQWCTAL